MNINIVYGFKLIIIIYSIYIAKCATIELQFSGNYNKDNWTNAEQQITIMGHLHKQLKAEINYDLVVCVCVNTICCVNNHKQNRLTTLLEKD